MNSKRTKEESKSKFGGLAFFSSLVFLTLIALLNISQMAPLWNESSGQRLLHLLFGLIPGIFIGYYLIKGKYSVLIHEFKHSIVSSLAGNKWRGMKVDEASGSFTYAYSKRSAPFNAFISLAPYWFPLALILATLVGLTFWRHDHLALLTALGVGIGADIVMNARDALPYQTDFQVIRGGYIIGIWYVLAMNLALYSSISIWAIADTQGLIHILQKLAQLVYATLPHIKALF